ncbi:hypothetical protein ACLKOZ_19250 [Arthrobacter sp. R4]|jgi:hypothetical protein|uniref:hypothetical protein n=1 Tax=Arthrobacter sp. R4 TaxID=644417 RepID=UPI003ED99E29
MTIQIDRPPARRVAKPRTAPTFLLRHGVRMAALGGAIVVLTFVLWLRLPEVTRGTLWAEDAAVFLRETVSLGSFRSIPEPYSGYLHVVPRVISGVAYNVAPIDYYGTMMSLLSCMVVAGISVAVFFLSRALVQPWPLRLMLAIIPGFLPVGPLEVLGNAANLHWFLLFLSPWLLLYEPSRLYAKALLLVAALATATSEIITGLFLPLAIWAIFWRKNFWAPAGLILGVALQLLVTSAVPRYGTPVPQQEESIEPLSVLYGFVLQGIGSLWESDHRTVASAIVAFGGFAMVIPVLLVAGVLCYILIFGRWRWKITAAYAFGAAVACWTAAIVVNAQPAFEYADFTVDDWLGRFYFFRYAAAPSMFLLTLAPIACLVVAERSKGRWKPGLAAPALMLAFLLINYLPPTTTRQVGPTWNMGVDAARAACVSDNTLSAASVHAAPAGWHWEAPCTLLLGR